jgi:hypothetical protein
VPDFAEVIEAARRKSIEVNTLRAGIIESQQQAEEQHLTIGQAVDEYLDFIKAYRKKRTHITYRYTLDTLLRKSYRKPFVDQVTREDILEFMTDCYKRGLGKRTVYDKLVVVLQLKRSARKESRDTCSRGQSLEIRLCRRQCLIEQLLIDSIELRHHHSRDVEIRIDIGSYTITDECIDTGQRSCRSEPFAQNGSGGGTTPFSRRYATA